MEVLGLPRRETAGGNPPNVGDLVVLERRPARRLELPLRDLHAFVFPLESPELTLIFNAQTLLAVALFRDLVRFPFAMKFPDRCFGDIGARLFLQPLNLLRINPEPRGEKLFGHRAQRSAHRNL